MRKYIVLIVEESEEPKIVEALRTAADGRFDEWSRVAVKFGLEGIAQEPVKLVRVFDMRPQPLQNKS